MRDAVNFANQVLEGAYGTKEKQRKLMVVTIDKCVDKEAWKDARLRVSFAMIYPWMCKHKNSA